MRIRAGLPGFVASAAAGPLEVDGADGDVTRTQCGGVAVTSWDLPDVRGTAPTLVVSRVRRRTGGAVGLPEISALMRDDPTALTRLLPPFGAMACRGDGSSMVADSMGFEQLYHSDPGPTHDGVLSSSALAARAVGSGPLDESAVGVQSLLGWQLGQRTLFAGVHKLAPGAVAAIDADGVRVTAPDRHDASPISMSDAVATCAELLRSSLTAVLDDHPDAVLQLTGGMDSRLLLSAIPTQRRNGLRAMTLRVPGTSDVAIADAIARRYGIRHEVHGLADIAGTSPSDAWRAVVAEAIKLDTMADPVALAAQRIAEGNFDQGVRISGLGGEIARGFYYVGRVRNRGYDRKDAERLASWRMFVNDAVEPGLLRDEFAGWARREAYDGVYAALRSGGDEWFRATDALYVQNRMQRWAGATDVAVSNRRTVINPMLDHDFLAIAARLSPQDKAHSRFLAALQVSLDPELGAVPLDGRPAPEAYAHPSPWQPVTDAVATGRRFTRKALQRVRRGNRPPAGGSILASKVVEHWRAHPDIIAPVASLSFVDQEWVERMIASEIEPRPSSVSFLTNLVVASEY